MKSSRYLYHSFSFKSKGDFGSWSRKTSYWRGNRNILPHKRKQPAHLKFLHLSKCSRLNLLDENLKCSHLLAAIKCFPAQMELDFQHVLHAYLAIFSQGLECQAETGESRFKCPFIYDVQQMMLSYWFQGCLSSQGWCEHTMCVHVAITCVLV